MSFYVGAERFEPTQRDAQWRNRCTAEVQSCAEHHAGSGKISHRSRNPILGIEPNAEDKIVVVPNPEKIGARNAPEPGPSPSDPREPVKKQINWISTATGGLAPAVRSSGVGSPSPALSEAGSATGYYACGRRPGSGAPSSTASALSVKSGLSSSVVSSSARSGSSGRKLKPGVQRVRIDDPTRSVSGKSNSSAGAISISKLDQISQVSSVASTRSSIILEALGEETRRRVLAEKEVMRLETLLEEQRAG